MNQDEEIDVYHLVSYVYILSINGLHKFEYSPKNYGAYLWLPKGENFFRLA